MNKIILVIFVLAIFIGLAGINVHSQGAEVKINLCNAKSAEDAKFQTYQEISKTCKYRGGAKYVKYVNPSKRCYLNTELADKLQYCCPMVYACEK